MSDTGNQTCSARWIQTFADVRTATEISPKLLEARDTEMQEVRPGKTACDLASTEG
jgi:hypothetical protein